MGWWPVTPDDNPTDWIDALDHSSTWTVLGPRLWLLIAASRATFGLWPRRRRIDEALAARRALLNEELRIRVAREKLQ